MDPGPSLLIVDCRTVVRTVWFDIVNIRRCEWSVVVDRNGRKLECSEIQEKSSVNATGNIYVYGYCCS